MSTNTKYSLFFICSMFYCTYADYCNIPSCNGRPHVMCTYKSDLPSDKCTSVLLSIIPPEEKQLLLDLHNTRRRKIASGQEVRGLPGPQAAAKKMPDLEWDDELEALAVTWAHQCSYGYDDCRDVERFKVGQNIALWGVKGQNHIQFDEMVAGWYNQVQLYDSGSTKKFTSTTNSRGEDISQFTQFVWAESTKLGCGAIDFVQPEFNVSYLVCNYGPAGNVMGMPVYEIV